MAGKVDAAVVWEPDVTEALQKRPGSHILVSTQSATNLIADLMVAREDFIKQYPDVIRAFVKGWLEGTEEANRKPDQVVKLLMDNEPLYKDLGEQTTRAGLSSVKWADLTDNTMMFGLDGSTPFFDGIFNQAGTAWRKRGYISQTVTPGVAKDDSFLKEIYAALPKEARPLGKEAIPTVPPPTEEQKAGKEVVTKQVNIYFATGSAELDQNARQALEDQVKSLPETYANAYIRIEGNTDNTGNPQVNVALSDARARAVVEYLVGKGIERTRLIAKGNGSNNRIASNDTNEGRAKNRRTEIKVVPRT